MIIALRSYHCGRRPSLQLAGDELVIRLPGLFGARQKWSVPLSEVAFADLRKPADQAWDFAQPLRVPYACTTSPLREPNLALLFARPQRVPAVRRYGGAAFDVSRSESRSAQGAHIDGLEVRAKDPDAALRSLTALGAEVTDSPQDWLGRRRQAWPAPARMVHPAHKAAPRWPWAVAVLALLVAAIVMMATVGSVAPGPFALAGLAIMAGLRRRGRRRWNGAPSAARRT